MELTKENQIIHKNYHCKKRQRTIQNTTSIIISSLSGGYAGPASGAWTGVILYSSYTFSSDIQAILRLIYLLLKLFLFIFLLFLFVVTKLYHDILF